MEHLREWMQENPVPENLDKERAIELLRFHCSPNSRPDGETPKFGFLGMLRPFNGELYEENFYEVINCVRCLTGDLQMEFVRKDVIRDLWGMCFLARLWGVDEGGMLRRNNLISDEQVEVLEGWIEYLSYMIFLVLDGAGPESSY